MRSLIDPKPLGAFIEYTLKPILDEVRDILELCDNDYNSLKRVFFLSVWIYTFERIFTGIVSIICTGIVCWTLYHILLNSPNILL